MSIQLQFLGGQVSSQTVVEVNDGRPLSLKQLFRTCLSDDYGEVNLYGIDDLVLETRARSSFFNGLRSEDLTS